MIDAKLLRSETTAIAENLRKRGYQFPLDDYLALEEKRKQLQIITQDLQNQRTIRSKTIGKAKAAGDDIAPLLEEISGLGGELDSTKAKLDKVLEALKLIQMAMPNVLHSSVSECRDENDNVDISRWF